MSSFKRIGSVALAGAALMALGLAGALITACQLETDTNSPANNPAVNNPTQYTVSAGSLSNGSVTPNPKSAAEGAAVTLLVNPASGYQLKLETLSVKQGDTALAITALSGVANAYTFAMPAANVRVSAEFEAVPGGEPQGEDPQVPQYTVSADSLSNGSVTPNPKSAAEGATVTLLVNPASGYQLKTGTLSAKQGDTALTITPLSDITNAYTFAMPGADVRVSAEFETRPSSPGSSSSEAQILSYFIGDTEGDIDESAGTITVVIPADQTDFAVKITISEGATVALLEAERNGVSKYQVTAEDGTTTRGYTVTKLWLGGAELTLEGGPFISGASGLSVSVTPSANWPNAVSRTVGDGKENHFVLTATPGYDHYRWYVDGEQFYFYNSAEASPDSNVVDKLTGGNYAAGKHTLFLVAIKNGVPYTWEQVFTVTD